MTRSRAVQLSLPSGSISDTLKIVAQSHTMQDGAVSCLFYIPSDSHLGLFVLFVT